MIYHTHQMPKHFPIHTRINPHDVVDSSRTKTLDTPSFGKSSKCLATATTSRVEYGYVIIPFSTISRNSANARHNRLSNSGGTEGAYAHNNANSDASSGLSIALIIMWSDIHL